MICGIYCSPLRKRTCEIEFYTKRLLPTCVNCRFNKGKFLYCSFPGGKKLD